MNRALYKSTILLALGLIWIGCGADGGAAPVMSNLTLNPTEIDTGKSASITASFNFADADGDVAKVRVGVALPGGQTQERGTLDIQGASGVTAANAAVLLALTPPSDGTYTFTLTLIDDQDIESNSMSASVEATTP